MEICTFIFEVIFQKKYKKLDNNHLLSFDRGLPFPTKKGAMSRLCDTALLMLPLWQDFLDNVQRF